jgi:hypothetical protein
MSITKITKLFATVIDLLKILIKSNFSSKSQLIASRTNVNTLRILGNGKSLKDVNLDLDGNIEYMVVNRHVLGDNYTIIKPRYYVLADPHFFSHEEGKSVVTAINENTTWEMVLCVPYAKSSLSSVSNQIKNPLIKVVYYNATPFRGLNSIKYKLYTKQLAMPIVQNVMVACIMLGITMNFDIIELYGVEHSWTKYLFVDDKNVVYLENPHFFDKQKVEAKPLTEIQHTDEYPFYTILEQYSRMFKSYWEIKTYLKNTHIPIKVYNCCRGSFIDAFERKFS